MNPQAGDVQEADALTAVSTASSRVMAGAAVIDITPSPGLLMCGYAARTEPATGTHDPLTARALVIDDTALVVADVLGFARR